MQESVIYIYVNMWLDQLPSVFKDNIVKSLMKQVQESVIKGANQT